MLEKFKEKENELRDVLPVAPFYAVRMDGRAFHTFTKQFKKPYSETFMKAMNNAGLIAAQKVMSETQLFYVQSDEITLILRMRENGEMSFGGRMDKVLSLTSSAATAGFLKELPDVDGFPIFDSRVVPLKDKEEIVEYLDWRRLDARKNAISMTAEHVFGHKALKNKSTSERLEMLVGTDFEKIPYDFYFGRIGHKIVVPKTVEVRGETLTVDRKEWTLESAFQDVTKNLVESL